MGEAAKDIEKTYMPLYWIVFCFMLTAEDILGCIPYCEWLSRTARSSCCAFTVASLMLVCADIFLKMGILFYLWNMGGTQVLYSFLPVFKKA
eukprot:SAG31_NODE_1093_length_9952_cov_16.099056_15_plen_92_part_00